MATMNISELKAELEKHHCRSFGWAMVCCEQDRAQAEDVLQTVYLKILEGKAPYRGEASFKTWLFAVIRNTAAGERRKSLLRRLKLIARQEHLREPVSAADEQVGGVERSETRMRFRRALWELPPRQRETLHLVFYQDLSLQEAAAVMRISVGSARRHYERGKNRLRQTLFQSETGHGIEWRGKKNPNAVS